jgi:tRNA (guanine37-N1)-methyltransferase
LDNTYVHPDLVQKSNANGVDDILSSVLPDIEDVPSGFTTTGHIGKLPQDRPWCEADQIGHMNLRDEWLPYKALIGQVILDVSIPPSAERILLTLQKNRNLRTVVNKLNSIHAQYRYFDMEVLAGDKDFITQVVSYLF